MSKFKLSVIVPIYNEAKYLPTLIESINNQAVSKGQVQLIFIDGGSIDDSVEILKNSFFDTAYGHVSILHNPKKIVPVSLNLGIHAAFGKIIVRLDAHSSYPGDYFSSILYYHSLYPEAMNIGFPCETKALNENSKSNAIACALSTRIGVGNSEFRVGINEITQVDTVPFGSYKRKVFDLVGNFHEKLKRNQDIELNRRIKKAKMTILLIPKPRLTYYCRETFRELYLSNYNNGLWNIYTAGITNELTSLSIRHYIPLVFVSLNIFLFFLFFCFTQFIFLLPLLVYMFILLTTSLCLKTKRQINPIYLFISYLILHFSYGLGSLTAIFKNLISNLKYLKNG